MSGTPEASHNDRPASPNATAAEETRAAIDVMFEALAHIQASMETSSEEARKEAYANFKNALYSRFEQAVEDRSATEVEVQGDGAPGFTAPPTHKAHPGPSANDSSASSGEGDTGGDSADDGDENTLEKFWPSISVD